MNTISVICISTGIGLTVFAVYMIVKVYRILRNLDGMLEDAISGTYEEKTYDESRLSKLESKLSRFLSASKLSLNRLEEQKNQIEQTVSDLSHQTKTPLANLLLYTEYLSEKKLGMEEKTLVTRIGEQTEKLNFLIQSLVKISRLENDLINVHGKKHSLNEFLKVLYETYQEKAIEKEIKIHTEFQEMWAVFDEKWTLEAVGNILDNAIKYTNSGGNVWIRAKEYELFSMIEIEDDGIGIAKEEQANIFTRFYRSQRVSQMPGVGIGLYLSRKIISLEGGYLKVISEEEKGTQFQVYLPKTET
ncbi:MAG: HAMP domain-containing histidine kinase [Lachnospiraceae bacterium]|nr:HAMP domain-containing histidine kinase [Lachnospiraceae bacterium]